MQAVTAQRRAAATALRTPVMARMLMARARTPQRRMAARQPIPPSAARTGRSQPARTALPLVVSPAMARRADIKRAAAMDRRQALPAALAPAVTVLLTRAMARMLRLQAKAVPLGARQPRL